MADDDDKTPPSGERPPEDDDPREELAQPEEPSGEDDLPETGIHNIFRDQEDEEDDHIPSFEEYRRQRDEERGGGEEGGAGEPSQGASDEPADSPFGGPPEEGEPDHQEALGADGHKHREVVFQPELEVRRSSQARRPDAAAEA